MWTSFLAGELAGHEAVKSARRVAPKREKRGRYEEQDGEYDEEYPVEGEVGHAVLAWVRRSLGAWVRGCVGMGAYERVGCVRVCLCGYECCPYLFWVCISWILGHLQVLCVPRLPCTMTTAPIYVYPFIPVLRVHADPSSQSVLPHTTTSPTLLWLDPGPNLVEF